jgi:hypothetical protein
LSIRRWSADCEASGWPAVFADKRISEKTCRQKCRRLLDWLIISAINFSHSRAAVRCFLSAALLTAYVDFVFVLSLATLASRNAIRGKAASGLRLTLLWREIASKRICSVSMPLVCCLRSAAQQGSRPAVFAN